MNRRTTNQFEVLTSYSKIKPHIQNVREAADAHRSSLGFFASSVYEEFARKERIYVLIENEQNSQIYCGHLIFDIRYPRATIRQMFISPNYRKRGLATKLLKFFQESLTQKGLTSIYARVATDLIESNEFWEKQHFYIQRQEKGGASKNRQIFVRCHELDSPQLFSVSGISSENPLGLKATTSNVIPLFLLDLNVLFDLAGPRRARHDKAITLFQAERMNFCRLAISNEIREELQRTRLAGKTDPMEGFISIFPSFPLLKPKDNSTLLSELAQIIFPSKTKEMLSSNDWSDVSHIATVIQHDLAGLITNDAALLTSAAIIESKYGVEIVSTSAFEFNDSSTNHTPNNAFFTSETTTLNLLDVSAQDAPLIHSLLSALKLPGSSIGSGWVPTEDQEKIAIRRAVWSGNTLIGYMTWSARGTAGITTARLAVDEKHPQALSAVRILLIYLLEQLTTHSPLQVNLELSLNQSHAREIAVGFGFKPTQHLNSLTKLILGKVMTRETWTHNKNELSAKNNLRLPSDIPTHSYDSQYIQIFTPSGNREHVSLETLESALSPALFCLPGRPAVITPVQRSFSEPLLGHSLQNTLLPHSTASLFQERHYVSSSSTLKHFKKGTIILFYESAKQRGRCEIVAIARVCQAYLKPSETLDNKELEQSVLNSNTLTKIGKSKMKTVTVFDNIFALPRPVPLKFLQDIGCGRPNDLITTKPISDSQLEQILKQAYS